MTKGEIGLQQFCIKNLIECNQISVGEEKTPDFELRINNTVVIAEVKDIELNDEEKEAKRQISVGKMKAWGSPKIGSRVRDAITKGNRQLREITRGKLPGILVLFDTRPWPFSWPSHGFHPYEIKVGMYGFETYDLSVPTTLSPPSHPTVIGRRFGKGKRCAPDCNTSTSAIAVMQSDDHILLYHNIYSAVPLSPATLSHISAIKQYRLKKDDDDDFGEWEVM